MIPRVVTTVGPLWETELVERARMTGTLRIAERAFHPAQVHRALAEQQPDAVLVGTEIPWLSHGLVNTWRQMGTVVIGVNDPYQPVKCRLLEEPDPEQAAAILLATRSTNTCHTTPKSPKMVAVGGPRGAPGRTEVAVGLAWLADRSRPISRIGTSTRACSTQPLPGTDYHPRHRCVVGRRR